MSWLAGWPCKFAKDQPFIQLTRGTPTLGMFVTCALDGGEYKQAGALDTFLQASLGSSLDSSIRVNNVC